MVDTMQGLLNAKVLPASSHGGKYQSFYYHGSTTTPDCNENVHWMVAN
jgi:carbonic anhydrase